MNRSTALKTVSAAAVAWALRKKAKGLDGTRWRLRLTGLRALPWLGERDELRFERGEFLSARERARGLPPGRYRATEKGLELHWSADLAGPAGERTAWRGVRRGPRRRGSWLRIAPDGRTRAGHWKARQIRGALYRLID